MSNKVSVSILSADLMHMENDLRRIEQSGAQMLHFDVMDGVFVKNISFGQPLLKAVDAMTDMHLDVHLMITDPIKYISDFGKFGADTITFHIESESDVSDTIKAIKEAGAKAGLALKPKTPFSEAIPYMNDIDMLLIMTVEPGFGGQAFMEDMLPKIEEAKKYIDDNKLGVPIQVDGGINGETVKLCTKAGASIIVAGSYLFKGDDMKSAVATLV